MRSLHKQLEALGAMLEVYCGDSGCRYAANCQVTLRAVINVSALVIGLCLGASLALLLLAIL